jgi:hypothetical protein
VLRRVCRGDLTTIDDDALPKPGVMLLPSTKKAKG